MLIFSAFDLKNETQKNQSLRNVNAVKKVVFQPYSIGQNLIEFWVESDLYPLIFYIKKKIFFLMWLNFESEIGMPSMCLFRIIRMTKM